MSGKKEGKAMEFKFLFIKTHQAMNSKKSWTRAKGGGGEEEDESAVKMD